MPLGKKPVLLGIVAVCGMAAGLFFRRDPSPSSGEREISGLGEPVTRRLSSDSTSNAVSSRGSWGLSGSNSGYTPPAATGSGTTELGSSSSQHRALSPVGALLRPLESQDVTDMEQDNTPGLPELRPATGISSFPGGARTHKVTDGDTLMKLAATYLGSSDRYLEIYRLNSDILTSPDLLPIGKTLRIPPGKEPGSTSARGLEPIPPGAWRGK